MRPRVFRILPLIFIVACPTLSLAAEEPQDPICRLLFDTYIVHRGKVNTRTILAPVRSSQIGPGATASGRSC